MIKSDASGSIQFPDDPIAFPSAEDDVIKGFPFSGFSLCMTSSSSRLKPFIISKSSESFLMRSNLLSSISFFILRNLWVSRERVQILIILGQSLRLTPERWTLALLRYWRRQNIYQSITCNARFHAENWNGRSSLRFVPNVNKNFWRRYPRANNPTHAFCCALPCGVFTLPDTETDKKVLYRIVWRWSYCTETDTNGDSL